MLSIVLSEQQQQSGTGCKLLGMVNVPDAGSATVVNDGIFYLACAISATVVNFVVLEVSNTKTAGVVNLGILNAAAAVLPAVVDLAIVEATHGIPGLAEYCAHWCIIVCNSGKAKQVGTQLRKRVNPDVRVTGGELKWALMADSC